MSEYTLRLSETEVARYRMMSRSALRHEVDDWRSAGVRSGAAGRGRGMRAGN